MLARGKSCAGKRLYYYGARYYDSRTSIWLCVDALATYDPFERENFIDGEHNDGVYNSFNHAIYGYCYQNPIIYIDPNGKQSLAMPRVLPRTTTIPRLGPISIPKMPVPPVLPAPIPQTIPDAKTPNMSRTSDFDWDSIDLTDTQTWPKPPVEGNLTEGDPSRTKPEDRGEKSYYDDKGGEWRPHKPDNHHPQGHWDYKPGGNNTGWQDIYPGLVLPKGASLWEKVKFKYQLWKYERQLKQYEKDMKQYEKDMKESGLYT